MNAVYLGTLCFLAGCYSALQQQIPYFAAAGVLAAALCVAGAVFYIRGSKEHGFTCIVLLFFLCLGLVSGFRAPEDAAKELAPYYGRQVQLYGKIEPESVKKHEYGTSFIAECVQMASDGEVLPYRQKIRIFTTATFEDWPTGMVWCSGRLEVLSSFRNPGGFDSNSWNRVQGIGGSIRKAEVTLQSDSSGMWEYLAARNRQLRQRMTEAAGQQGALLGAMVLGGSAQIDEESRRLFTDNGLAHLLSVSGSHLVVLTGFLMLLFGRLPSRSRAILTGSCLVLYAALCGCRPPVMRALLMSLILLYGGSGAAKGNILCLSAVVMLIFKPLWLSDAGFLLSFGAAAGLIWLLPVIKSRLSCFLPLWLSEAVAVTVAAQLPVVPFMIVWFHQLPLISLLSNILLTPVLELSVLLTISAMVLDTLFGFGIFFLQAAAFLVQQVLLQAELLASLPWGRLVIGALPGWCAVIYYFWLAIVLDLACVQFLRNKERHLLIGFLTVTLAGVLLWSKFAPQPLTAYFLDVGQGDSAVVVTPSGATAVIDTGGLKNYDTGSRIVAPFLRSIGKDRVDVLLLSHGDFDHVGGVAGLAANIGIDMIIVPPDLAPEIVREVLHFSRDCVVVHPQEGQQYSLGGEGLLSVVSMPEAGSSGNDACIVAVVDYAGHKLLFPGDISTDREAQLQQLGHVEVLKVAHHGSRGSSSDEFLQQIHPSVAVISAGRGNSYGHPHPETLQRLKEANATVLRTDQLGAVKIVFDDDGTKCYSYVYHKQYF